MDPSERIPAMLTRVKAGDGDNGFQGEDLLSAWGYQGSCEFTSEAFKHLAACINKKHW